MKLVSVYPGLLVLPDGTEVRNGAEVEVSKETAVNAGVAEWIEAGHLVKPGSINRVVTDDSAELKEALDQAAATNAALQAQVAALQADLEAAT